ncbi:hypothetical protein RD792_017254 [Penstemon davidsonii]|uniref:Uncharacterized protein n=1 Tax=Penstemon davidsonii TaxID=160366 RepID=A0ABR0CMF7_9LAMI|nr:hypothetical protein RD792_017254 [Penstemon davidsonii]
MANFTLIQDPETPNLTASTSKNIILKGSHNFEIQGFSITKGMGVGKYISSDTFLVGGHLWEIRFYPDGKRKNASGDTYVSLFITLVSKCKEDVRAWFEYVLLDQNGDKWYKSNRACLQKMEKDTRCMFGPYTLQDSKRTIGFAPFYKRTELEASQFIKDDCLAIQCTVGVVKTSLDVPNTFVQPLLLSDLGQSYAHLLESRKGSDVSFEVEGETFYAHKFILSIRSPVFKAQFFGPLKEENTRCIKIETMHASVFKVHKSLYILLLSMVRNLQALLHFIYCDAVPDLDSKWLDIKMAQQLLAAADQYGIERLRSLCEARLCENIAIDIVASSLALAEQHGCFQLKSTCLEFIRLPQNLKGNFNTLPHFCKAVDWFLFGFL